VCYASGIDWDDAYAPSRTNRKHKSHMDDRVQPQKARAWCQARGLPALDPPLQRNLARIVQAVQQAIYDDADSIPRDVRVYYQALKYILAVAGAPDGQAADATRTPEPALTDEQLTLAAGIDAHVRQWLRLGCDDLTIMTKMSGDDMANFKVLLDTTTEEGMNALCARFAGFQQYAHILERVASGIASGEITVPT